MDGLFACNLITALFQCKPLILLFAFPFPSLFYIHFFLLSCLLGYLKNVLVSSLNYFNYRPSCSSSRVYSRENITCQSLIWIHSICSCSGPGLKRTKCLTPRRPVLFQKLGRSGGSCSHLCLPASPSQCSSFSLVPPGTTLGISFGAGLW